jgi:hypothetical protein
MSFEFKLCPECKAPDFFTREHLWLNNGDIVQGSKQNARLAFIECENLDPLFKGIGEIIGMPIEHMIVNIATRGIRSYIDPLIPGDIKDVLRSMKPGNAALKEQCRQLIASLIEISIIQARITGYGNYIIKNFRYERDEKDYAIMWVTEPYSLPFAIASHAAHTSALVGGEHEVGWKEISPGEYELISHWAPSSEELKGRLLLKEYNHKEGDLELDRCGTCGGPAALSGYKWYLDKGVIKNTFTGRRMAMLGPALLDPVFNELEEELGETIPQVVVEAQRRFIKTGFYSIDEVGDEGDIRTQLALRGLGNLKEIQMEKRGVYMRLENAALHLIVVGMVQGLFEMAFDVDSYTDWELTEEGDLELEVKPKTIMEMVDA